MKLTKFRLTKQINGQGKQTRRKFKKELKLLNHSNTSKAKKPFNLKNRTLKNLT